MPTLTVSVDNDRELIPDWEDFSIEKLCDYDTIALMGDEKPSEHFTVEDRKSLTQIELHLSYMRVAIEKLEALAADTTRYDKLEARYDKMEARVGMLENAKLRASGMIAVFSVFTSLAAAWAFHRLIPGG